MCPVIILKVTKNQGFTLSSPASLQLFLGLMLKYTLLGLMLKYTNTQNHHFSMLIQKGSKEKNMKAKNITNVK